MQELRISNIPNSPSVNTDPIEAYIAITQNFYFLREFPEIKTF